MVRSGYVGIASTMNGGLSENVWSRVAAEWGSVAYGSGTFSTAYNFYFYGATDAIVNTSNGPHTRLIGMSLRCLSTAVEGEECDILKLNIYEIR